MANDLIRLTGVSKSFPGVKALDNVSFDLRPGEVHALLGENGAGKSTLMKIIAGIYQRDSGEYLVRGEPVGDLTPKGAQELGIAIIHQELNMCSHLTVAENMFLGREPATMGVISRAKLNQMASEVLDNLHLDIDPNTVVGRLTVSKQQMVEIAKALSVNAKILIMDEPTSALTDREINDLFRIIKELKESGHGIIYISHRLEELTHITDRITVFRDGQYVTTKNFADTSIPEIISWMVGREIKEKYPRVPSKRGKKILSVQNLSAGDEVKDVSFDLYEGEIIGIAGLMGAGRTEMVRCLSGAAPKDGGEIELEGKPVNTGTPIQAIRSGVVCAPEDRKREGLCVNLSIRENVALANLDQLCTPLGVVNRRKEARLSKQAIDDLRVKTPSDQQLAKNLSGGNQQKIVVGKWLLRNAKVVIFDEPTRGIDVAAKVEIYNIMNRLKQEGIGVLFVSSELPEVLGMADRILVMCNGRITGDFPQSEASQEKIMACATKYDQTKEM